MFIYSSLQIIYTVWWRVMLSYLGCCFPIWRILSISIFFQHNITTSHFHIFFYFLKLYYVLLSYLYWKLHYQEKYLLCLSTLDNKTLSNLGLKPPRTELIMYNRIFDLCVTSKELVWQYAVTYVEIIALNRKCICHERLIEGSTLQQNDVLRGKKLLTCDIKESTFMQLTENVFLAIFSYWL